jgi:uncharacterized protein (DUF2267 family)
VSGKEKKMSSKGLEVVDHSVQLIHEWLNELSDLLGWSEQRHVLQLLRSTLMGIRDHLPHEESADFAAQLPIIVRGLYFENWRPAVTPVKDRSKTAFLDAIAERMTTVQNYRGETDITTVLEFLNSRISVGETSQVRNALPPKIRDLWPKQV